MLVTWDLDSMGGLKTPLAPGYQWREIIINRTIY
ncbi:MAG: hypothetical protein ACI8SJ_002283 [Shewanella sp.]|jgi:hypothetical protein